jgi:uncharacterized repeat protein (TIGR03803 family)
MFANIPEVKMQGKTRPFPLLLISLCLFTANIHLSAQTFSALYSFNCTTDGCGNQQPIPLPQGRDGDLYSQSYGQGPNGDGTDYKINPTGTFSVIFARDSTGHNNNNIGGGLVLALDGNFYGVDQFGGANSIGDVYRLTPAGVRTVLYSFNPSTDNGFNLMALTLGPDGNLYGIDTFTNNLFKITVAKGAFSIVKKNVAIPGGAVGLTLGADGKFYGVTVNGGTNGKGTVFSMTTAGKVTVLHDFNGTDGLTPVGIPVQASDGNLYGTTVGTTANSSIGTIYKITPSGAFTLLHTFASDGSEGINAYAGLVAASDGNLYGTANNGGGTSSYGTIFKITRTGTFNVVHVLNNNDLEGNNPWVPLRQDTAGTLYGVTNGGTAGGGGGIYELTDSTLTPFIVVQNYSAKSAQTIDILGTGLTGATTVKFGSISASSFKVVDDGFMTAVVSPAAATGLVSVTTPSGTVSSLGNIKILPTVTGFSPPSGPVGTSVIITGTGLTGATKVTFGGVKATTFTVNSGTQITAIVPNGALTGKIGVTTAGGGATSKNVFTVN